jgi:CTP:molybdopterin cytidylyltransferase MocA
MTGEKQRHGMQEVLQAVEDALIKHGYDHLMVVTRHGSFQWMTVDRARERRAEERHQSTRSMKTQESLSSTVADGGERSLQKAPKDICGSVR